MQYTSRSQGRMKTTVGGENDALSPTGHPLQLECRALSNAACAWRQATLPPSAWLGPVFLLRRYKGAQEIWRVSGLLERALGWNPESRPACRWVLWGVSVQVSKGPFSRSKNEKADQKCWKHPSCIASCVILWIWLLQFHSSSGKDTLCLCFWAESIHPLPSLSQSIICEIADKPIPSSAMGNCYPAFLIISSLCCSVPKSRLTLFNPVDCSTPGFTVLHHLLIFAQALVHWVHDAIQPSHPLSPPSPPAFSLSQHQGLF